jgi:hypothetical protein
MYGAKPKQLSVKALDNDTDQSHVNDVENTGFCDETILVMLKKDIDSFPKTLLVEWHFFGLH